MQNFWQAGVVTLETLYAQLGMSEWKPLSGILDVAMPAAPTPILQPENSHEDERRTIIETVVNVIVPLENFPAALEGDELVKPEEMGLPKMRLWLRDKLVAIGFAPETEKTVAEDRKFDHWLPFSGSERETIFGANNSHRYAKRDLTGRGLIRELKHLAASTADRTRSDAEWLAPANALWIMDMVLLAERVSVKFGPQTEPTEAEKEKSERIRMRLEARMSLLDPSLDPINKVIQAARIEFPNECAARPGELEERKQPEEIHLTKLRLWLLDNLTALGLTPQPDRPVINANQFIAWLGELSKSEQNTIFGAANMELYRARYRTSQDLLDELERMATCIASGSGQELLELVDEMFDSEGRIVANKVPQAIAIIEHAVKKGAGSVALISEANSMLSEIYAHISQTDKVAACWQQRVAAATSRGEASEIVAVARALREESDELTPEVAAQIIGLAEAALVKVRGFGLLCEAFDLLIASHSKLGHTEDVRTCRQRHLEAAQAAIEKGIPVESNQRSNAYGRAADLCEQIGRPDEAADYRKQQLEQGDGFGLLETAVAKFKACGKTIDKETGTRLLSFLTKAVERIPEQFLERHAVAYRVAAEISEVLGDKKQAVEYYECALQKNHKAGVKQRLSALRKELGLTVTP